jgi:TolB-like protein/Flp pilus assembly protein TadD
MTGIAKPHPITIDLNQFKLHLTLKNRIELTLHFNSPSRRFYLSVIALVVNEMKRQGKIISIPLEEHHDLLALLNETIGGSAGSSDKENLLPRIYRKWQYALPNLEEDPLFMVLGRKKGYEEGIGKTYHFTETEKDSWANFFEYKGSEEHVRLKFAIDKIGVTLNDIVIIYEDSLNGEAWEKFISGLKEKKAEPNKPVSEEPEVAVPPLGKRRTLFPGRYRWVVLIVVIGIVAGAIWKIYFSPAPITVASVDRMKYPLPDKPSIAVLPFVNLSDDPKQDYLSDGITETIITTLSSVPQLLVIARNSTFTYKGKAVKVQTVAEELGVRYVLEGSMVKSGNRIRVTAQLIDALRGHYLWAERYDREMKDLFSLQDDLALKILIGMELKLTSGEQALHPRFPKNLEVWLKYLQAYDYSIQFNIDNNNRARLIAEECIAIESDFWGGYLLLGCAHMMDYLLGSKDPAQSLNLAIEYLEKAAALTDRKGRALMFLSHVYAIRKDYDKGIELGQQAVSVIPNGADAHAFLAMNLNFAGRPEEALPLFEKAMRLNPLPPPFYYLNFGSCYRQLGRFEEAITMFKKSIQLTPNNALAHQGLACTCALAGREEEAKAAAAELLRINPKFTVEYALKTSPYKDKEQITRGLRKAGLK